MKKNSLDIYWENKLDFKYEEEILRYKMLCNDKISKKLVKKYNINPKYNTFSDWEKYIKEKEEIRKNAIIVVHVGQHWSSENEKEALIKNYIHHA